MKTVQLVGVVGTMFFSACQDAEHAVRMEEENHRAELKEAAQRYSEAERKTARAEQIQRQADALITTLQTANRNLESEVASLKERLSLTDSKMESMRRLGRAEAQLEYATKPSLQQQPPLPVVTNVKEAPAQWVPPQRHMMEKIIRQRAEREWPDNYSMIESEIERQTKALNRLLELNRWAGNREIIARAAEEWHDNYAMILNEFERQAKAKARLSK